MRVVAVVVVVERAIVCRYGRLTDSDQKGSGDRENWPLQSQPSYYNHLQLGIEILH